MRAARAASRFKFNSQLIKIVGSRELGRGEIYGPDQLEKREAHREFYDARNQKRNFKVRTSAGAARRFTVH